MSKTEPENQFVAMVKECVDSKYALQVLQKFTEGKASISEISGDIPGADASEITEILEKVTRYTLVAENVAQEGVWTLTDSGKEFLAILTDIERLKLRYQN